MAQHGSSAVKGHVKGNVKLKVNHSSYRRLKGLFLWPIGLCLVIYGFLLSHTARIALPSETASFQAPSQHRVDNVDVAQSKSQSISSTKTPYQQFLRMKMKMTQPIRNNNHSESMMILEEPMTIIDSKKRVLWLTYVPTGGGLSDQILELQMALHLARQSGRQLLLPPFLTDARTTNAGRYGCCEVENGRLCPAGDKPASNKSNKSKAIISISWSEIIDMDDLAERLGAIDGTSQTILTDYSQLTLSEFNRCNTRWGLRIREECDASDSDLVPSSSKGGSSAASIIHNHNHSAQVIIRSLECLFDETRDAVDLLRFVDLIATMPKGFVPETINYSSNIVYAAWEFFKPMEAIAGGGAIYACARLKSSQANDENPEAVTRRITTVFSQIQTYLERQKRLNPTNAVLIYVSTDNNKNEEMVTLVKETVDICGTNGTCFFLSDVKDNFADMKADYSLLFQAVDSHLCRQAHRLFPAADGTNTGTTPIDWYIEASHPARVENIDNWVPNNNDDDTPPPSRLRSSIGILNNSTQGIPPASPPINESFAACLLIMDDNHYLVEWLAYHYQFMPLRRLIVAVDPKSNTSPADILNRYSSRGLIDISIWNDSDFFFPTEQEKAKSDTKIHRLRQNRFIGTCCKTLREEDWTWTMHIDTDEYIVPNPYAFPVSTIRRRNEQTLYRMLNDPQNEAIRSRSACHPMARLNMGTHESSNELVNKDVPLGFNGSDYMTMRYRWPQNYHGMKPGKAMVDLSRVPRDYNYSQPHNPHRPLTGICMDENTFLPIRESSFVVYHYAGTYEQFTARIDSRKRRNMDTYNARSFDSWSDDSARFWLEGFVKGMGPKLATELLENAGGVAKIQNSSSTPTP